MNEKNSESKKHIITFWVITGILAFILAFSGFGALTKLDFLVEAMQHIGFPFYVMKILGTAYLLAAIAILFPRFPKLKEWAYAGVMFAMIAATAIHISIGDTFAEIGPPVMIASLTVASYMLRPERFRL